MSETDSESELREDLILQLKESLSKSREMMSNERLDPKARERWTQLHTNTAQVLNTVLRDQQYKDWEKRLKELEEHGHIPKPTLRRTVLSTQQAGRGS
jgi:hypothetical protein